MKGSFLIKAKQENIVTEKGVRAFIMERLLNSSFEKGSVVNIDKKTVQIQLEGDEKQVKEFVEKLKRDVAGQFGNPTIYFTSFQENPALELPDLMKSSQALMVGQLQKGIGVQLDILAVLKSLPRELGKILNH